MTPIDAVEILASLPEPRRRELFDVECRVALQAETIDCWPSAAAAAVDLTRGLGSVGTPDDLESAVGAASGYVAAGIVDLSTVRDRACEILVEVLRFENGFRSD